MAGIGRHRRRSNLALYQKRFLVRLAYLLKLDPLTVHSCFLPPGMSTVCFVAESHLYVETWPESRAVNVVVDSCKWFETGVVITYCRKVFRPERMEHDELVPIGQKYRWHNGDWVDAQKAQDMGSQAVKGDS